MDGDVAEHQDVRTEGLESDHRISSNRPENGNRRQILDTLIRAPGLNQTEVIEETNLGRGSVEYHLGKLESLDHVYSLRAGRERHYFLSWVPSEAARRISSLRKGRSRAVAEAVLADPGAIQTTLRDRLGMTRKILRGYLNHLCEGHLIVEEVEGRCRRYYPTERLEELVAFLSGERTGGDRQAEDARDGRREGR